MPICYLNMMAMIGGGKGIIKLYERNKLIDEILCENVGCEYGEYQD